MQKNSSQILFKGTAYYYSKYRLGYPKEFFNQVISYFHLDGKGILLDLGCVTEQIITPLARHFQKAVGVDPEKEMLVYAKKRAQNLHLSNTEKIQVEVLFFIK